MPHDDLESDGTVAGIPGPIIESQIAEVLALVDAVLGPDIVGAYLHGSAVLGGLRLRSDIDILVVAHRPTTHAKKQHLVAGLLAVSNATASGPRRPIELTIVVQSQVRPWRYPPRFDFQYGEWMRLDFESGNVEPWPTATNPDLASLITMVLLANRPLLGPPPAEVLDPVPRADYLRAIVGDIGVLLSELDEDTRNVLLTLARIWSTVATDVIRPKDAAAAWALAHLPPEHQPILARARAIYLGDEDEFWDDVMPLVRPCVAYMVESITRLDAEASPYDPSRAVTLLN